MKFIFATLALVATAIATAPAHDGGKSKSCKSGQTIVCKDQGKGGLLSLGNIAPGALGENCSGGDVYCCDDEDVSNVGLVNLDVNAKCSLNDIL